MPGPRKKGRAPGHKYKDRPNRTAQQAHGRHKLSGEGDWMNRALLLLTAFLLSCQGALAQSGEQKTWDETLKAARQEGKVVVAGPPDTQVRQTLPAAFEARYGIKMEYVTGRGSDQAAKLRREREA